MGTKRKFLKSPKRSNKSPHSGNRMTSDFSIEMMESRTQWSNVFKILRETDSQVRIVYPAELLNEVEEPMLRPAYSQ